MAQLLDSSVWVALFLEFDAQHEKAVRVFGKLKGLTYVPYCVVSEVTTVLAYKHSKAQADSFLAYLQFNPDLRLLDDNLEGEIEFYRSVPQPLSFTDAALILFTRKLNATLITFDKQLARAAEKIDQIPDKMF